MKTKQHLLAIALTTMIIGCSSSDKNSPSENLATYLKEDSTLNLSAEELEALTNIQQETKQITSLRKRTIVYDDSVTKEQDPVFPKAKNAGVFIRSEKRYATYSGAYQVTAVTNSSVAGTIADKSNVNIFYRLPGNQQMDLPAGSYQLQYDETVVDGSVSRTVFITRDNKINYAAIQQGSNDLYTARFKDLNLTIRQLPDKKTERYPVEIQFNNETFVMTPGETHTSGETNFFLQSSVGVERDTLGLEGQAFYVRVYVFK